MRCATLLVNTACVALRGSGCHWMALDGTVHGTGWHWMSLDGTGWHCMALHGTAWHCMALCTALHEMAVHGTAWHWMALHGTPHLRRDASVPPIISSHAKPIWPVIEQLSSPTKATRFGCAPRSRANCAISSSLAPCRSSDMCVYVCACVHVCVGGWWVVVAVSFSLCLCCQRESGA
jgi:hypothetical protein